MALQLVNLRTCTITAKSGANGFWLVRHIPQMSGLYLMVLESTGTNPPSLNIRGGGYGEYGETIPAPATPYIRHVNLDSDNLIILIGTGEGDGKTRVTFIKIGETS